MLVVVRVVLVVPNGRLGCRRGIRQPLQCCWQLLGQHNRAVAGRGGPFGGDGDIKVGGRVLAVQTGNSS